MDIVSLIFSLFLDPILFSLFYFTLCFFLFLFCRSLIHNGCFYQLSSPNGFSHLETTSKQLAYGSHQGVECQGRNPYLGTYSQQQYNPYLNAYNPGWHNLPIVKKLNLEEAVPQMASSHTQFMNETRINFKNRFDQIMILEVQISQLAKMVFERQQGSLPSASKVNLKGEDMEHYKTITLRNGKEREEPKRAKVVAKKLDELVDEENGLISPKLEERKKLVKKPILGMTLWGDVNENLESGKMPYILKVDEIMFTLNENENATIVE